MTESEYEILAAEELQVIEDAIDELDPDIVDMDSSAGVITLSLSNGVKVVINNHRAAQQIWMAAVDTAWHFAPSDTGWADSKTGEIFRDVLSDVLYAQVNLRPTYG